MNEQQTKEAAAVMNAAKWVDGKCVNVETTIKGRGNWFDNDDPDWNWEHCQYRIKPEPEYRYVNILDQSISIYQSKTLSDSISIARYSNVTDRLRFEVIDGKLTNPVLIGLEDGK